MGEPPVQTPLWHVSSCVHALASLQGVPSGFGGAEHSPVMELHVPAEWHASGAWHTTGFCPVHVPAWQVSTCVHALPSSHTVPSGLAGFEHMPVAELHLPGRWQASGMGQITGDAPVQTPLWHV